MAFQSLPAPEGQAALAKMVMALMDHWKLEPSDQAAVLGILDDTHLTLAQYRRGEFSVSVSNDRFERIVHLLDIHQKLRLLFPQNLELAYLWMMTRNKAFGNLTPAQVIGGRGLVGLVVIRDYLEGSLYQ